MESVIIFAAGDLQGRERPLRVRQFRPDADCFPPLGFGAIDVALLSIRKAQLIVSHGVVRFVMECRLKGFDCCGRIILYSQQFTFENETLDVIGTGFQNLIVELLRLLELILQNQ